VGVDGGGGGGATVGPGAEAGTVARISLQLIISRRRANSSNRSETRAAYQPTLAPQLYPTGKKVSCPPLHDPLLDPQNEFVGEAPEAQKNNPWTFGVPYVLKSLERVPGWAATTRAIATSIRSVATKVARIRTVRDRRLTVGLVAPRRPRKVAKKAEIKARTTRARIPSYSPFVAVNQ
jgi:hypothetical protein